MALIHKNLYNDNVSSGLEVRDYVIQLTQQLLQTYGLNPDQIELQLDVDPISLDVSTLVPLALIINELITNSLKYAFEQHEAGKIKLSLKTNRKQQAAASGVKTMESKGSTISKKFRWLWHQVDFPLWLLNSMLRSIILIKWHPGRSLDSQFQTCSIKHPE